jgi:hypothetical protein
MVNAARSIQSVIDSLIALMWGGSYSCTSDFSSRTAFDQATQDNLVVVKPEPNQLFVDIDNLFGQAIYEKNIEKLAGFYTVLSIEYHPSKSGLPNKQHITITLAQPVEPMERLILQAFLGSDLTREFLGLQRIKANDAVPTLFLERKTDDIQF